MILTHEEYGRLVSELVKRENNTQQSTEIRFESWIDYFIYGDLYVLGQEINFAEFDLWWLLSRRRREKTGTGYSIYYTPRRIDKRKDEDDVDEALDQIGMKIMNCGITLPNRDSVSSEEYDAVHREFYEIAMKNLRKRIENPLPLETEKLIDYRDKCVKNETKSNKLRLLYQLTKTNIIILGYRDDYGVFYPYEYNMDGSDPFLTLIFSSYDEIPEELNDYEELREMTGLEILDLMAPPFEDKVLALDFYSENGGVWFPYSQAVFMKKDPEFLKEELEKADNKDLVRRKRNAKMASEADHFVRSFISNNSFYDSLDQLWADIEGMGYFNYEMILNEDEVQWTSPTWAAPGDIVFFAHTGTAIAKISKLQTELRNCHNQFSDEQKQILDNELKRARKNYKEYGGKIFAIGQVCEKTEEINSDDPFYDNPENYFFKSRKFSCITNIIILKNPVSYDEYRDFIALSKTGSITDVYGEKFDRLRQVILDKNMDQIKFPKYFLKSVAAKEAIAKITDNNWMLVGNEYRRKFVSKNEFQNLYTDYLLKAIGDTKKFGLRCRYSKPEMEDAFMDNVILFGKRWLPVKIFVGSSNDDAAMTNLEKYCHVSEITLSDGKTVQPPKIYTDKILVIDKKQVAVYDSGSLEIKSVQLLDDLKSVEDVILLKQKLTSTLEISGKSADMPETTPHVTP